MSVTHVYTEKKYIGAGIILIHLSEAGPRYLMLKGSRSGIWSFSKGHPEFVDRGSPLRTAVRETEEETGYVNGCDYTIIGDAIRFGKRPYWLGVVTAEVPPPMKLSRTEHVESAWLSRNEIVNLDSNTDVRAWAKKAAVQSNFTMLLNIVREQITPK
jgi:8-oxo-dGTP pyrophosphatase MutT (NUDIX family)